MHFKDLINRILPGETVVPPSPPADDSQVLDQLRNRDIRAFKQVCCDHSENMTALAFSILGDMKLTNQVVDEVLYQLWNETDLATVKTPFQQYLHAQVLQACKAATDPQTEE